MGETHPNREKEPDKNMRLPFPNVPTPRVSHRKFIFRESGSVRRSDPVTSQIAAENVDATGVEMEFLKCLAKHGPSTAEEVTDRTGIPIDSTTPRTAPLVRKGLIVDSREKRPGKSGRKRIVWKLAGQ